MRHVMFQRTVWLAIRFSIKMMETRIHWDGISKWWKNTNFKKILLSKTVIQKHSKNKDVFRKKMRYEGIYYRKMHSKTLKKLFKTAGNYTEIRIPGGKYLGISVRILISLNKNNDVL